MIEALDTDPTRGLTAAEVARRQEADGPNEIVSAPPTPWWRRLGRQFTDPLVLLLLVAIGISLIAWWSDGAHETPLEAIVIAAIVVLNAGIGFWQETKAIKAVATLQRLTATRSSVVREGVLRPIDTIEMVVGDLVMLAEGDAVGADCRLTTSLSLRIAEAPLTGESTPVAKSTVMVDDDSPLAERTNMVHSGTAVAAGRGVAIVTAIGMSTEVGGIAALLDRAAPDRTPLQRELDWVSKLLGLTVVGLATVVVGAILLTSEIETASDMVDALLVGVSLAVAAVPEGLPAILSVVLALGVQRMADMMLTGRVIDARSGLDLGISQYLVDDGEGLATAMALAERIAQNSPVTNYAVLQTLPRIAEMGPQEGLFVESLIAAISQGSDEAKSLLEEFLTGRAAKVVASEGAR